MESFQTANGLGNGQPRTFNELGVGKRRQTTPASTRHDKFDLAQGRQNPAMGRDQHRIIA
jgi:hypothetical protein